MSTEGVWRIKTVFSFTFRLVIGCPVVIHFTNFFCTRTFFGEHPSLEPAENGHELTRWCGQLLARSFDFFRLFQFQSTNWKVAFRRRLFVQEHCTWLSKIVKLLSPIFDHYFFADVLGQEGISNFLVKF